MKPGELPLATPPWGDVLAPYFVLLGLASGVTLMIGWVNVGRGRQARLFELRCATLSLAALAVGGTILLMDLGRPSRFWLMLAPFSNPASPMAWGAKLIGLKAGLLALQLYLLQRRLREDPDGELSGTLTHATFRGVHGLLQLTSLALAIYPAFLLSRTWMSPLATTPGSGVVFLTSALLLGTAALLLLQLALPGVAVRHQLSRCAGYLVALQGITLLFEALSLRGAAWSARLALSGAHTAVFWGAVVVVGLALPLFIRLVGAASARATTANAAAIVIGAAAARYLLFAVR